MRGAADPLVAIKIFYLKTYQEYYLLILEQNLSWKGCPKIDVDDRFCLICLHADRGGSQTKRLHVWIIMGFKFGQLSAGCQLMGSYRGQKCLHLFSDSEAYHEEMGPITSSNGSLDIALLRALYPMRIPKSLSQEKSFRRVDWEFSWKQGL